MTATVEALAWWDPGHLADSVAVRHEVRVNAPRMLAALRRSVTKVDDGELVGRLADAFNNGPSGPVMRQLARNFDPKGLGWVIATRWHGPVDVDPRDLDLDAVRSWTASHQPERVAHFARQLRRGKPVNPVVVVRTPRGTGKPKVVDGHHRVLAALEVGQPVEAYVGDVPRDRGPWDETHSYQEHAGADPANKSAETPMLSSTHHPLGTHGLWGSKADQLPAYIQNIAHALMRDGHPESSAIAIAVGTVKRWARGGGKVTPEVRAAAAKAVAEWYALRAKHAGGGGRKSRKYLKLADAHLQKVGPHGYIHGWIKVGVGVDSTHLKLKKTGEVEHKATGHVIGHVAKKTDFPHKGTTTFTATHANGIQVYHGVYKKEAMAALAKHHNESVAGAQASKPASPVEHPHSTSDVAAHHPDAVPGQAPKKTYFEKGDYVKHKLNGHTYVVSQVMHGASKNGLPGETKLKLKTLSGKPFMTVNAPAVEHIDGPKPTPATDDLADLGLTPIKETGPGEGKHLGYYEAKTGKVYDKQGDALPGHAAGPGSAYQKLKKHELGIPQDAQAVSKDGVLIGYFHAPTHAVFDAQGKHVGDASATASVMHLLNEDALHGGKPSVAEPKPSALEPSKPHAPSAGPVLEGHAAYQHVQAAQGHLAAHEAEAVATYGTTPGYTTVNPYLNKGLTFNAKTQKYVKVTPAKKAKAEGMIAGLDGAFAKAKPTTQDLLVHRRMNHVEELIGEPGSHAGKTFTNKSYVSTSTFAGAKGGHGYDYESKKALLDIRVPAGSKVILGNPHEREIILPRGSKFTVDSDEVLPDGTRHVKLTYHPEGVEAVKPATSPSSISAHEAAGIAVAHSLGDDSPSTTSGPGSEPPKKKTYFEKGDYVKSKNSGITYVVDQVKHGASKNGLPGETKLKLKKLNGKPHMTVYATQVEHTDGPTGGIHEVTDLAGATEPVSTPATEATLHAHAMTNVTSIHGADHLKEHAAKLEPVAGLVGTDAESNGANSEIQDAVHDLSDGFTGSAVGHLQAANESLDSLDHPTEGQLHAQSLINDHLAVLQGQKNLNDVEHVAEGGLGLHAPEEIPLHINGTHVGNIPTQGQVQVPTATHHATLSGNGDGKANLHDAEGNLLGSLDANAKTFTPAGHQPASASVDQPAELHALGNLITSVGGSQTAAGKIHAAAEHLELGEKQFAITYLNQAYHVLTTAGQIGPAGQVADHLQVLIGEKKLADLKHLTTPTTPTPDVHAPKPGEGYDPAKHVAALNATVKQIEYNILSPKKNKAVNYVKTAAQAVEAGHHAAAIDHLEEAKAALLEHGFTGTATLLDPHLAVLHGGDPALVNAKTLTTYPLKHLGMVDSKDLSFKQDGTVVHKGHQVKLGTVEKQKDFPSKGTTTFTVKDLDGNTVYTGPYKGQAQAALAQHHNQLVGGKDAAEAHAKQVTQLNPLPKPGGKAPVQLGPGNTVTVHHEHPLTAAPLPTHEVTFAQLSAEDKAFVHDQAAVVEGELKHVTHSLFKPAQAKYQAAAAKLREGDVGGAVKELRDGNLLLEGKWYDVTVTQAQRVAAQQVRNRVEERILELKAVAHKLGQRYHGPVKLRPGEAAGKEIRNAVQHVELLSSEKSAFRRWSGEHSSAISNYIAGKPGFHLPANQNAAKRMQQAIARSVVTQPFMVQRNISGSAGDHVFGEIGSRVGKVFTEHRFAPTTTHEYPKVGFGPVHLRYHVKPGAHAVELNRYNASQYPQEGELLLNAGQRYRVLSDQYIDGYRTIELETVDE